MPGMEKAEEFEHNGRHVVIYYDDDLVNPRKDFENFTTIAAWHPRYDFGDDSLHMGDYESADAVKASFGEVLAILPVYLYDHSGLSVSTEPFHDPWDSGQVGWAYITAEQAAKADWGQSPEELERYLRQDVRVLDQFLQGEVYGYVIDEDGDSCWGMYGLEHCIEQAKEAAG